MQAKILKLSQTMILLKMYVDPWWQILSKSQSSKGNFCDHHHDFGYYRKTSNIRRTLVGNKIVDHSDVVGASAVGAAPTTSSFST